MEIFFCSSGDNGIGPLIIQMRAKIRCCLEGTRACDMFDVYCKLVEDSYTLKILLFIVLGSFIVPTFAFVAFAGVTFVTTFAVFILLEGAILLLSAYAAIIWLGAVVIFFVLSGFITLGIYFLYRNAENTACKIEKYFFPSRSDSLEDDMVVIETDHED